MIKLSNRLRTIFEMIPDCSVMADIGCDHGYLSIEAAITKASKKVIAMDINKGPLECARTNVEKAGLSEKIELRLSNGLEKLSENEADVICICGMGGLLMQKIISAKLSVAKKCDYIILEPQSEMQFLREYLLKEGFYFWDEALVSEENKIYPVMKISFKNKPIEDFLYTEVELKYGPVLLKKVPQLLIDQLKKENSELKDIIEVLESKVKNKDSNLPISKRLNELSHELELNEEANSIIEVNTSGKGNN